MLPMMAILDGRRRFCVFTLTQTAKLCETGCCDSIRRSLTIFRSSAPGTALRRSIEVLGSHGLVKGEGTDGKAFQGFEPGPAPRRKSHVPGQGTYIGAGRTTHKEPSDAAVVVKELKAMDGHGPRLHLDGLAAERPLIGALAVHVEGRICGRSLHDGSREKRQNGFEGHPARRSRGRDNLALGIEGISLLAEEDGRGIDLVEGGKIGAEMRIGTR